MEQALEIAVKQGLSVPLVYNSGGYDSLEIFRILDGVIDIYMPDMKYSDGQNAERLSGVKDYPEANRAATGSIVCTVLSIVSLPGRCKFI